MGADQNQVTNQSLQRDPAIAQLTQEIEQTKESIAQSLLDYDYICLQLNPRIEIDYALKIGCYENEALQAEVAARRAKRKLALLLQATNAGRMPDEEEIEAQLKQEMADWEQQLKAAYQRYQQLLDARNKSGVLPEPDAKELSRLYRIIVRRLHPDINPGASQREQDLLLAAQIAYGNGDLLELQAIAVSVEGLGSKQSDPLPGMDRKSLLEAELIMLQTINEGLCQRLNTLKESQPYCYLEKLDDRDWVAAKVLQLQEQIALSKAATEKYAQRAKELREQAGGAQANADEQRGNADG